MKKRLFQRALILIVLVMLIGCASIPARVSSCQQMLANTFLASNRIPRKERQALLAFYKATHGGDNPPASGTFPCKSMMPPCQWSGATCASGHVTQLVYVGGFLSGGIPPELGNLSQLKVLVLSNNYLTGGIPAELGNLSQLKSLDLADNQLSGPIPPELGNLSQLQHLHLAGNELCVPQTAEIEAWIAGIGDHDLDKVPYCE